MNPGECELISEDAVRKVDSNEHGQIQEEEVYAKEKVLASTEELLDTDKEKETEGISEKQDEIKVSQEIPQQKDENIEMLMEIEKKRSQEQLDNSLQGDLEHQPEIKLSQVKIPSQMEEEKAIEINNNEVNEKHPTCLDSEEHHRPEFDAGGDDVAANDSSVITEGKTVPIVEDKASQPTFEEEKNENILSVEREKGLYFYEMKVEASCEQTLSVLAKVIDVDIELNPELVKRNIKVNGSTFIINWESKDPKKLRSSITNIIENMKLVLNTVKRFPGKLVKKNEPQVQKKEPVVAASAAANVQQEKNAKDLQKAQNKSTTVIFANNKNNAQAKKPNQISNQAGQPKKVPPKK